MSSSAARAIVATAETATAATARTVRATALIRRGTRSPNSGLQKTVTPFSSQYNQSQCYQSHTIR